MLRQSKINTHAGPINAKNVLRARGTLFWPKVAREATKFDETRSIRSEITRGIVSNRSQGPDMDKMNVFSIFSAIEMALQVPVPELRIWGERAPGASPVAPGGAPRDARPYKNYGVVSNSKLGVADIKRSASQPTSGLSLSMFHTHILVPLD